MSGRRSLLVVTCIAALAGGALWVAAPASAGGFCAGYAGEKLTDARGQGRDGDANVVLMKDNCFQAIVMRVAKGATVKWENKDAESHTVGGVAGTFGDMHAAVRPGGSVSYRFGDEGVYPYACIFHPGMAGAIVVGDGTGGGITKAAQVVSADAGDPSNGRSATTSSGPSILALALGTMGVAALAAAGFRIARPARPRP